MALNLTGLEEIVDAEHQESAGKKMTVPPDRCYPDPDQPRKKFVNIPELAESLKENGQLQPIGVHPADPDGRHKISFGQRRWMAAMYGKLPELWIVIADQPSRVKQLVENVQREDLLPYEIADTIRELMETENLSQKEVVAKTGKSKSWVSRYAKIASAPAAMKPYLDKFSDYTALSDLIRLHGEAPEKTLASLAALGEIEEITRLQVDQIGNEIKGISAPVPPAPSTGSTAETAGTQTPAAAGGVPAAAGGDDGSKQNGAGAPAPGTADVNPNTGKKQEGGKAKEGSAAPRAPAAPDVLGLVYQAQKAQPGTIRTYLDAMGEEDWLKIHRMLNKEHSAGVAAGTKGIGTMLARRLASGEFSPNGGGLYLMLAFIEGATNKTKFDNEQMRVRCFEAAESVVNPAK